MSQKNQGPKRMEWWISGEWPGGVIDNVLKQSICLTINKSGLTPEQIAKRVDANEVYVREALDALEAEELVEKVGRGRYRNMFVAVGAEDWMKLSREIRTKTQRVGDLLVEALPELQAAWEKSPKPAQGFDWNAGIWPMVAALVCQFGLPRNGSVGIDPQPPLHSASGRRYSLGGREIVTSEHVLWALRWGLHLGPGFNYGFLWPDGLGFGRRPWSRGCEVDLPNERRLLLRAVASGFKDIDSAAKSAGLEMEEVREAAASAIELGLLERRQDGLELTFPVFTSEDDRALLPVVDSVSERLAGEVAPVTRLVDEKLSEFGFGHLEEQFGAWHGSPKCEAAAEGVRVLYNRGILPHPGDPTPANFCMVGWFGQKGLFAHKD